MKALGKASVVAAVAGAGLALSAVPASAAYTFFDDDYIKGGTTAAVFDGSWGPNGDALVRWTKDSGTFPATVRGEIKSVSIARVRSGSNPRCIAVKARWRWLTGTASFSAPSTGSFSLGIRETSDGYTVSCRDANSSTPPRPISMGGHAASGRSLLGLYVDVCHKPTATSLWVCATDGNSAGDA